MEVTVKAIGAKYPYHSFTPQSDITAWELAQIIKAMKLKVTANLVTPEIARHFTADTGEKQ